MKIMTICLGAVALVALAPFAALAQQRGGAHKARAIRWPAADDSGGRRPTLKSPRVMARGGSKLTAPTWTRGCLWTAPPRSLHGLARVEKPGLPAHDAETNAWYASANGCLVRVAADGSLPVLSSGIQGVDVHVRAARGLAVSREPDHRIVLHRFGAGGRGQRTLLRGARFFSPRLSPDGTRILVSESRPGGGRMKMLRLDGRAVDLGPGTDPAWHPDGRRVIFSRVRHDGARLLGADLWQLDVVTRKRTRLAHTGAVAEISPAVSVDGRWVAFVNGRTGDLLVARLPGGRP